MNLKESINHFLPKIKLFSPKNEIDYYGFSYYLNKKLGFKNIIIVFHLGSMGGYSVNLSS